ncbi:MAG: 4-phosphoerythronate dehydrogenase [Pseudomonadota bacterium]
MKIIADEHIPAIKQYFGGVSELILKQGRDITRADLLHADALFVRSVTRVDSELLHDTPVKFVGSVATGIDHLDTQWLTHAGINWYAAQGFNAVAVMEYVIAVVAGLQKSARLPLKSLRAGVIGVGTIGKLVVEKLTLLGFDVIQCDPLRARAESDFHSVAIADFHDLDLVTIHTPLTRHGDNPTYHLIDRDFLQRQQKQCVLINTARGAVINFQALKQWGENLSWCLDVWENEPLIDVEVLRRTSIATPHIAGYSVQSKLFGVQMLYEAACKQNIISQAAIDIVPPNKKILTFGERNVDWRDVVLKIFDPCVLTKVMRKALAENNSAQTFDDLRKHFNGRYEFACVELRDVNLGVEDIRILSMLGVSLNSLSDNRLAV